jgi:hypothetical protein
MKRTNYFLIAINIYLLTYFGQFVFNYNVFQYLDFGKYTLSGILFFTYLLIAFLINPILFLLNIIFIFSKNKFRLFLSERTNKIIFIASILLSISNIIFTILTIATLDER